MKKISLIVLTASLTIVMSTVTYADKLDEIIDSGKLRCAVTLDNPPIGFRDASNKPVGFDVDYCEDLAKALGVKSELIDVPFPDRIPAMVSGRVDVVVASVSDTLERAKVVGMSIPYFAYKQIVLTREDTGINTYADLKGRPVGDTQGNYEAIALENDVKKWNDPKGSFRAYQTQSDTLLAVSQGHIDAAVVVSTVAAAAIKSGQYKGLKVAGDAPYVIDYVALAAQRNEYGFINYLNLFINQQVRTGRYAELWKKWVTGEPVDLTIGKVYR